MAGMVTCGHEATVIKDVGKLHSSFACAVFLPYHICSLHLCIASQESAVQENHTQWRLWHRSEVWTPFIVMVCEVAVQNLFFFLLLKHFLLGVVWKRRAGLLSSCGLPVRLLTWCKYPAIVSEASVFGRRRHRERVREREKGRAICEGVWGEERSCHWMTSRPTAGAWRGSVSSALIR